MFRLRAASPKRRTKQQVVSIARELRRAARCKSGIAATEFAMVLPIMVFMFFGLVEGADALSASRRATVAVNSLADLAAQSQMLDQDDVDNLFTGVERMLDPSGSVPVEFRLMSVVMQGSDVVIDWSIDNSGDEPYSPGSPYDGLGDETLLDDGASLIVVELSYHHETSLVNRVFDETIVFTRQSTRWPRLVPQITFCDPGPCPS